jgi:hypothetical protein
MRRALFLFMLACGSRTTLGDDPAPGGAIDGGTITGVLTLREGDCMPPTTPQSCRHSFVSRDVYLFPIQKAIGGNVPTMLDVPPVARGHSDSNGRFTLRAPAGHWSFFAEDQGHLYANTIDGHNDIDPVDIVLNGVTAYAFEINHATD